MLKREDPTRISPCKIRHIKCYVRNGFQLPKLSLFFSLTELDRLDWIALFLFFKNLYIDFTKKTPFLLAPHVNVSLGLLEEIGIRGICFTSKG